jgi:hypothetical protein
LAAPPLISTRVFKDEVNESATNHEKNMGWKNNLCNFENVVESGIHQTNYEGFQKNSLDWSLHLLWLVKKYLPILNRMSAPVVGSVLLLLCCSSSSVVAFMMGGDKDKPIPSTPVTSPVPPVTSPVPDPTQPPPPSTNPTGLTDRRISKSTPSNEYAQGSLIHLDRHDVKCDATQGISGFTLTKDGNDKMKYNYKCLDVPMGALGPRKDTGPQDWGGNRVIYLDRHSLDCGTKAITEFGLYRPATNKLSYEYKCSTVPAKGKCRNVSVRSLATTGTKKIDTLLDLDVECEKDEVMTKFRYYRDEPNGKYETGGYRYTCCKLT